MGLFKGRRRRNPGYPRSRRTPDELSRRRAEKMLLETVRNQPELDAYYVSKLMGIHVPASDSVPRARQRLEAAILEHAVKRQGEDDTLVDRMCADRPAAFTSKPPQHNQQRSGPGYRRQMTEEQGHGQEHAEAMREHSGNDAKVGLMDTDGKTIGEFLASIILRQTGEGRQHAVPRPPVIQEQVPRIFVVQVDGAAREMAEAEYRALLAQGWTESVAEVLPAPKPPPSPTSPPAPLRAQQPAPEAQASTALAPAQTVTPSKEPQS